MNAVIQKLIDEGLVEIERDQKAQVENERIASEKRAQEIATARQAIIDVAKKFVLPELHEYLTTACENYSACYAAVSIKIPELAPIILNLERNGLGATYPWKQNGGFVVADPREVDAHSWNFNLSPDPRYSVIYEFDDNDHGWRDIRKALAEAHENVQRFAAMTAEAEHKNEEWRAQMKREDDERAVQERTGEVDQAVEDASHVAAPEPTTTEIFGDALRELVKELIREEHATQSVCDGCN